MAGYMTKLQGYVYDGEHVANAAMKIGSLVTVTAGKVVALDAATDMVLRVVGLKSPYNMNGMIFRVINQGTTPVYLVEGLTNQHDDDDHTLSVVKKDAYVRMHRLLVGEEFTVSTDIIAHTDFIVGDWLYAGEVAIQVPSLEITKIVTKVRDTSASADITGGSLATFVLVEGDVITYSVTVENTGDLALGTITLTDPQKPSGVGTISSLAAGATSSAVVYTHTVSSEEDGIVINTAATASAVHPRRPTVTITDTDSKSIGVLAVPSMEVTKVVTKIVDTSGPTDITGAGLLTFVLAQNDVIHYSVTVENTGDLALADISLADDMDADGPATIATLAIGATSSANVYTHTVAALEAGTIVENTATATCAHPRDAEVTVTASDTVTAGVLGT